MRHEVETSPDGLCVVPECPKAKYRHRNYCNTHYMRLYRYGTLEPQPKKRHVRFVDITGQRFGTLVAIRYNEATYDWTLQCDCGNMRTTYYWNLVEDGDNCTCGKGVRHYKPSYYTAHAYVKRIKGVAREHKCKCGARAAHWAYNHEDPNEYVATGISASPTPYSMNPAYYKPMCVSCHKKMDLAYLE